MTYRTPYTEDRLNVQQGTEPEDIYDFVRRRANNPTNIDGMTVWNFNNHELDEIRLEEQSENLFYDKYLIPFQASGVWGVMYNILPEHLRNVEILSWSQSEGRYYPFPNYYRHGSSEDRKEVREELSEMLE